MVAQAQSEYVQTVTTPVREECSFIKFPNAVGNCTISGKVIHPNDDYISDRQGRLYLVSELSIKRGKK